MRRIVPFCLSLIVILLVGAGAARAHDLPGEIHVSGFFDDRSAAPELVLRVPLILLTNVNLPKRGPGYLDLADIGDGTERAEAAVLSAFGISADGTVLEPVEVASRISLPSERTFETVGTAVDSIVGPPLPVSSNVFWNQGFFDVRIQYPPTDDGASYMLWTELPPGISERILISLGVVEENGDVGVLELFGTVDEIALDPTWYQAGYLFMTKGVEHILIGADHLLFLICLILPLHGNPRRLFGVVTAFTLGHSATLVPAALGLAPAASWFLPVVETLIAVSILYMAIENILGVGARLRGLLAFGFGLIHGFGFASTLSDVVQFAGSHLVTSLVFFNVGIEIGQVLILAAALPVLTLLFRVPGLARSGIVVISVLAAHEAWHWATERASEIKVGPGFGPDMYPTLTWIGLALILAALVWWVASLAFGNSQRASRR